MIRLLTLCTLALVACGMLPDNQCYAPHVLDTYDVSPLGSGRMPDDGRGFGPGDIGKTIQVPVKCGTFGTVAK